MSLASFVLHKRMTIDRGSSKSNDHIIDRKTDYSNDTSNWSQDKLVSSSNIVIRVNILHINSFSETKT